ncbi:hypothetical protein EDB81DRAFT_145494 [Dactylonectria macrodidyma]|uniref:Zn(2)-C6 fungal-type domain-containing protein n=1 Tax=Dactylonectria macrodidyma TaxID=307937 RepID=A0A9P9DWM0_9HYPO|nr:hypothetical protein EDB81DRAFT_145494 [Dactylonectria macrodidyma]
MSLDNPLAGRERRGQGFRQRSRHHERRGQVEDDSGPRRSCNMNYPRRRAPIACNFCRQRKRKCNGQKPACSLCSAAGITCDYQDGLGPVTFHQDQAPADEEGSPREMQNVLVPGRRSQSPPSTAATTTELLRRIEELESLVKKQDSNPATIHTVTNIPPHDTHTDMSLPQLDQNDSLAFLASMIDPPDVFPSSFPMTIPPALEYSGFDRFDWPQPNSDATEEEPLTIPIGHLTPTSSLFSLEPIQKLIGEYPEDFFFQIESTREFVPDVVNGSFHDALTLLNLDKAHMDTLLSAFFTEIHPHFPIIDQSHFMAFFESTMSSAEDETDTALCLTILALGRLACNRQACSPGNYTGDDGVDYSSLAYRTLTARWITSFGSDLSLALGLVYLAIYLCYLERPLHAWRLIHMASTKLQLIVSRLPTDPLSHEETDCLSRLCWTCFLIECDSLAEFHLPRSGIELIIDRMPFPRFTDPSSRDSLSFLAICSIRRLLNRIHRAIYSCHPSSTQSISLSSPGMWHGTSKQPHPLFTVNFLGSVCAELTRQLDVWYESLPDIIKPDLSRALPSNMHDGWLRLRYWSARHIICRPCLVYAAGAAEQGELPAHVMEYSERCIESCRQYILTASYVLMERTQYTWMTIQASLACAFVIAIASGSPLLNSLVPDSGDLLKKVIAATQRWASPGSSGESIGWILNAIFQKQRFSKLLPRPSFSASSSGKSATSV